LGLIADRLEAVDTIFQCRVVQIGNARFDCVIQPLEPQFRFGGALVEFGDMLPAALSVFLPAVECSGKNGFKTLGLEKLFLNVVDDQIVQLLHRHGHALAVSRSLTRLHRTGIVTVVIAPPHLAQRIRPVSMIGPLMTRAGMTLGLRALSSFWTASSVSLSMIGGTAAVTISLTGFNCLVLLRLLNSCSPI